jgi:hypothetical protein
MDTGELNIRESYAVLTRTATDFLQSTEKKVGDSVWIRFRCCGDQYLHGTIVEIDHRECGMILLVKPKVWESYSRWYAAFKPNWPVVPVWLPKGWPQGAILRCPPTVGQSFLEQQDAEIDRCMAL